MAGAGVGGGAQVVGGHQVGEHVVPHDGGVLVGSGDPGQVPHPVPVVVTQRSPEPRRLDQHGQPAFLLDGAVAGDHPVLLERRCDVGVDVPGGGARGPVPGAFLASDGPPRESRPGQPQLGGSPTREVQGGRPPAQRVGGGLRSGVDQHRQDEALAVPEGVAVITGAGQPLAGDGAAFGAGAGLQQMEQREADRLLAVRIAVDFDVGAVPELVEVCPLGVEQPLPAAVAGTGQRGDGLVAQRRRDRSLDQP